ncbi:hypothetical protein LCGC14_2085770 [marine sediment metagenome]|uniref:DUF2292 domain-containing protein n=1 Tax=marine sediment metagenome TaxID=412755 RepID=A0A0F9HB97_9ZZZZ
MCKAIDTNGKIELSEKERHLIEELREVPHGRVDIFMQEGQPVRIESGVKSKKL